MRGVPFELHIAGFDATNGALRRSAVARAIDADYTATSFERVYAAALAERGS